MLVDVQTISIVIAATSVVIGVINSILASRRAEKQRQTQIVMQLFNRMQEKDLREAVTDLRHNEWKDYADWREKHNPQTNNEAYSSAISMLSYYNGIGSLFQLGLIDIELVDELLGFQLVSVWQDSEFIIQHFRELNRVPWKRPMFQPFERLANQIQQRIPKQSILN